MYRVPAQILNQIAASQTLKTDWARMLFPATEREKTRLLENEAERLEKKRRIPFEVVMNYQTFAPLLAENEAISRFVMEQGNPALRYLLPEIVTVEEAMQMADSERPMRAADRKILSRMLKAAVG